MKRTVFLGLAFLITSFEVHAQDLDCEAVLRNQAFDTTNLSVSQNVMILRRDSLCSRDYSSVQEARQSARSSGFNLGYKALSIDGSDARQKSNGRFEITETEFCRATLDDFASAFRSEYESTVASIAVQSWLQCIQVAGENQLFMNYTIRANGAYFEGEIRQRLGGSSTTRLLVTGINAIGPGSDGVTCQIAGNTVTPESVLTDNVAIDATTAPIACSRSEDKDVSIAIATNRGTLGSVYLPSTKTVEKREWERIERVLSEVALRAEVERNKLRDLISANRLAVFSGQSGTACDDLNNTSKSVTVTFPEAFSEPPKVMVAFSRYGTGTGDGNTRGRLDVRTVGTDSFQVECASWDRTRGDYAFSWIAVGPK